MLTIRQIRKYPSKPRIQGFLISQPPRLYYAHHKRYYPEGFSSFSSKWSSGVPVWGFGPATRIRANYHSSPSNTPGGQSKILPYCHGIYSWTKTLRCLAYSIVAWAPSRCIYHSLLCPAASQNQAPTFLCSRSTCYSRWRWDDLSIASVWPNHRVPRAVWNICRPDKLFQRPPVSDPFVRRHAIDVLAQSPYFRWFAAACILQPVPQSWQFYCRRWRATLARGLAYCWFLSPLVRVCNYANTSAVW